jgi:hypothetical protein
MCALGITSPSTLATKTLTEDEFWSLCSKIVDNNLMPSIDRLEADGVKTLEGSTVSEHAVLLMFDLMTMREMRRAIKYGHPGRVLCMLKFWTPMFYASGSYNYAHECMELLHNYHHDWPRDTANVLLSGMLVNNTGEEDGFLECDLDVEHLNERVKDRVDEPNITPETLAKVTPALGHVRYAAEQLFADMGVDAINQHHANVRQQKDIEILVGHLNKANIFRFSLDRQSEHAVIDVYRHRLYQLAGPSGSHAKHLSRHKLRLRTRHGLNSDTYQNTGTTDSPSEFAHARDHAITEFTLGDRDDIQSDGKQDYSDDEDSHEDYIMD